MHSGSLSRGSRGAGSGGGGRNRSGAATTVSASAQLGASTRARTDPKRTHGTANAVAAGLDLSRVGVMSERELDWIRTLAYGAALADAQDTQRDAALARRKELSDARKARWPDTTEARQEAFLRTRQEEKDEAERRRVALDELYADQKEEERLAKIAAMELQRLREDPRTRNAKSAVLLHEAIKAREEQIAFQASVKASEAMESEQERNAMLMDQWGYTAEEVQKRLAARERNMAEKNHNLEMVLLQIEERRQQRRDEKQEGVRVRQEAHDEARENAEEEAERKQREREVALYNESHAGPRVTKSGKLQQRLQANAVDMADHQRQEERVAQLKAATLEKQKQKQAKFEERKKAGLQLYESRKANDSPKRRTQDRFESKPESFLTRMASEDVARTQMLKERQREQAAAAAGEAAATTTATGATSRQTYKKAEATASGFTSLEEEQAYLAEMRSLPATMRAEQEREAAERLAEAKRIEAIQKMQAAEKREQRRREVEQERADARRQRDYQSQEDARYHAYIESQVPADMSEHLRAKAMQLE